MIDLMPEPSDLLMCGAPFFLELLHLFVAEAIRLEFAPSVEAALITKR